MKGMEWNRSTKRKDEFGIGDLRLYDLRYEKTSRLFGKGLGVMEVVSINGGVRS